MYKNITHSFVDVLEKIKKDGTSITTRGNVQVEILSQLLRIENPRERVIVIPHRNNNIFALIAETFWVLGGRDDLAYLSHYLPRASDFSDDGLIWRAAYGPRLRNWHGTDQVREVVSLLRKDPSTKRAVMVIYDPQKDFVETKDVPCNNWLHFMIRDGRLHLNVTVRANDAIWGFGGINSFQWSILHEMMAFWTGTQVGTLSWFVGTIHIYERHYKISERIIEGFGDKTLYDFGIKTPHFSTPFSDFDNKIQEWLERESRFRSGGEYSINGTNLPFQDKFFKISLDLIYIYNRYILGSSKDEILKLLSLVDESDFKVSAVEFFSRKYKDRSIINELLNVDLYNLFNI